MDIELYGNKLKVFEDGKILVLGKHKNKGLYYEKKPDKSNQGYLQLALNDNGNCKRFKVHRIIAMVYLGLDIDDKKQIIDHIDNNGKNNNMNNLRIVTQQENCFNRITTKGYSFNKKLNNWRASIKINYKTKYLGSFDTKQEAKNAYLEAKEKYHIINQYQ
jgi:hypothetical protein